MPPKAKPAAGGPANVEVTPEALATQYRLQCEALQRQLGERTEVALAAQRQLAELGLRVKQMGADQAGVERSQLDVTAEMSRQYRAMQESKQARITALEAENAAVRAELAQALREIEIAKVDGTKLVRIRDEEIARLRDQMDSMARTARRGAACGERARVRVCECVRARALARTRSCSAAAERSSRLCPARAPSLSRPSQAAEFGDMLAETIRKMGECRARRPANAPQEAPSRSRRQSTYARLLARVPSRSPSVRAQATRSSSTSTSAPSPLTCFSRWRRAPRWRGASEGASEQASEQALAWPGLAWPEKIERGAVAAQRRRRVARSCY